MRGIEIDPKNYKLLCLNLLIQAPNADILEKFEKKNSLLVLTHTGLLNSIDVIGGNPPYGAKPEVERAFITSDKKVISLTEAQSLHSEESTKKGTKGKIIIDSYWGSLDKGKAGVVKNSTAQFMMLYLRALKVGGRCGIVIDRGILINGNDPSKKSWERDFRMEFMNLSEIWKIILLPKGIFETTSFDTAIIFFRKGNPTMNIEFVEGYFKKQDKGKGNKKMYLKVIGNVLREKIEEKLFSLDPKDYFGNEESIDEEQFMIPCEWKNLEDICDFKNGKNVHSTTVNEKTDDNPYPVLGGGIKYLGYCPNFNTEPNICLMNSVGVHAGRILRKNEKIYVNSNCFSLKSKENLNNSFIYYLLKYYENLFRDTKKGGGVPFISKSKIEKMRIPVPTNIEDQERIVKFCDYIFGASDIRPDFITFDIEKQNYHIDIAINFADNLYRYLLNEQYVEFIEKVKLAHQISYLPDIPIEIKLNHIDEEYEKNPDSIYDAFIMKEWKKITKDIEMEMKPFGDIVKNTIKGKYTSKNMEDNDGKNPNVNKSDIITSFSGNEIRTEFYNSGKNQEKKYLYIPQEYVGISSFPPKSYDKEYYIILTLSGGSGLNPYFIGNGLGKPFLIPTENTSTSTTDVIFLNLSICPKFVYYFLVYSTINIQKLAKYSSNLGHISIEKLKRLEIPIPTNPDDINRIVEYLDRKSSAFKELYT